MPETILPATPSSTQQQSPAITISLVTLLALYAFTRILQILPSSTPSTPIVALEILSALTFAVIHGAQHYRLRGILIFAAICLVLGNVVENIGVFTGFPYGHYEFLPLMGPQLIRVPILLGLAYIGMAYASWTLARLILGATAAQPKGTQLFTLPLLAAVIMTAWDFAQDPVWSTILHAWRWRDGGIWFGVPLTNYAGWLLTVFLIYFAFRPVSAPFRSHASARIPALARRYRSLCFLCHRQRAPVASSPGRRSHHRCLRHPVAHGRHPSRLCTGLNLRDGTIRNRGMAAYPESERGPLCTLSFRNWPALELSEGRSSHPEPERFLRPRRNHLAKRCAT